MRTNSRRTAVLGAVACCMAALNGSMTMAQSAAEVEPHRVVTLRATSGVVTGSLRWAPDRGEWIDATLGEPIAMPVGRLTIQWRTEPTHALMELRAQVTQDTVFIRNVRVRSQHNCFGDGVAYGAVQTVRIGETDVDDTASEVEIGEVITQALVSDCSSAGIGDLPRIMTIDVWCDHPDSEVWTVAIHGQNRGRCPGQFSYTWSAGSPPPSALVAVVVRKSGAIICSEQIERSESTTRQVQCTAQGTGAPSGVPRT